MGANRHAFFAGWVLLSVSRPKRRNSVVLQNVQLEMTACAHFEDRKFPLEEKEKPEEAYPQSSSVVDALSPNPKLAPTNARDPHPPRRARSQE